MLTFFSTDGSFGAASGMVMIDTRAWSNEDWLEVENATDDVRVRVAVEVAIRNGDM